MKRNSLADRLIRKVDTFPALPSVTLRIIQICANPETTIFELKRLVESDSALVVDILKLANSPFYGLRRRVTTVEHCLSLLGMSEIKNLVVAKTMFQTFSAPGKIDTTALWLHSFYCALAAKSLAPAFNLNPDELFVAGIIHDIGKLIIYMELEDQDIRMLEFKRPVNFNITQHEEKIIGISHDILGGILLESWMFPPMLVNAVRNHHHPHRVANENSFLLVVHIADLLSHIIATAPASEEETILTNHLLSPDNCGLAKRFGFLLDKNTLPDILLKLRLEIKNEDATISLLTNPGAGN